MGATVRDIVNDLMTDFKQTFDDRSIQTSQVAYWVTTVGNRLLSQHIGKRDSGAFLSVFADVPVNKFTQVAKNEVPGRQYIGLPEVIFDYDKDKGVEYIGYWVDKEVDKKKPPRFTLQTFTRTTAKTSERLYYSKYETPSPENPYFYRVGPYLYFLGIECVDVKAVEIGIYATLPSIRDIDLDAVFDFPEETLIILKRQVLDLGRFILMIPEERVNDGNNDQGQKTIPTNKITSVNTLAEDVPTNR